MDRWREPPHIGRNVRVTTGQPHQQIAGGAIEARRETPASKYDARHPALSPNIELNAETRQVTDVSAGQVHDAAYAA